MEENYHKLANAIILNAVKDLRKALKHLKKNPKNGEALDIRREVVKFFHSGAFAIYTDLDPDLILEKIEEEFI